MKPVTYSKDATRALRRLPTNVARLIVGKINLYALDPAALANNVKTLRGDEYGGAVRLRVGDFRVIMLDEAVISVVKIGSRGDVYD